MILALISPIVRINVACYVTTLFQQQNDFEYRLDPDNLFTANSAREAVENFKSQKRYFFQSDKPYAFMGKAKTASGGQGIDEQSTDPPPRDEEVQLSPPPSRPDPSSRKLDTVQCTNCRRVRHCAGGSLPTRDLWRFSTPNRLN